MAEKNTVYKYTQKLDISDVIKGLAQVQDALASLNLPKNGKNIFSNVQKDFAKLNSLVGEYQAQLERGFSSPAEVKTFEKNLTEIQTRLVSVRNNLGQVASISLDDNIKKATKELKDMQAEVAKIRKNATAELTNIISKSTVPNKADLKMQAELGQLTVERIKKEQQQNQDNINSLKQELKLKQQQILLDNQLAIINNRRKVKGFAAEDLGSMFQVSGATQGRAGIREAGKGSGLKRSFSDNALTQINEHYIETLKDVTTQGGAAQDVINKLTQTLKEYGVVIGQDSGFNERVVDDFSEIAKAKGMPQSRVDTYNTNISKLESNIPQYTNIITALQNYQSELSKAANTESSFKNSTDSSNQSLRNVQAALTNLNAPIQNFANESNRAAETIRQNVQETTAFNDSLDRLQYTVKYVFSITNAWRLLRQQLQKTYNDVKTLDKAFAEIAMVTNYSVKDMWSQYGNYAKMANELGQSTESVIRASGLFYQQGLDTNEALTLTRDTMKLATLATLDFEDATSQMTAALRAFAMDMDEGSHITDVYAEVAAHAAVDVKGLAQAMSATAAIAHSSGMSFENTTAMLATMVEATQEAPKNLGTALKAVLARFGELKSNVDASNSEFEDLDYNKVDKALKSVGISIKDASGQFRNMDEVLLELGSQWSGLTRNSQRYIATIAAGSRQQSRFLSLMENYERTMELIDIAQNSAGRSSVQFAKYEDTLEFQVNKLRTAWEQLRLSLLDEKDFKNAFGWFVDIADKVKGFNWKDVGLTAAWAMSIGRTLALGIVEGFKSASGAVRGIFNNLAQRAINPIGPLAENAPTTTGAGIFHEVHSLATAKSSQTRGEDAYTLAAERQREILRQQNQELEQLKNSYDVITNKINTFTQQQLLNSQVQYEYNEAEEQEYQSLLNGRANIIRNINNTEQSLRATDEEILRIERERTIENQNQVRAIKDQVVAAGKVVGAGMARGVGMAATTALTMALTGEFSAEDIAKSAMMTSFTGAVSSLLQGNWELAVGQALVGVVTYAIEQSIKAAERARDRLLRETNDVYRVEKELETLSEKQEEFNKRLDSANSDYDKAKEAWDNISKNAEKYKELTEKGLLDETETQELKDATKELAEAVPELITGYDAEGQAVIANNTKYDELIETYHEVELAQRQVANQAQVTAQALNLEEASKNIELLEAKAQQLRDTIRGNLTVYSINEGYEGPESESPTFTWEQLYQSGYAKGWENNLADGTHLGKNLIEQLDKNENRATLEAIYKAYNEVPKELKEGTADVISDIETFTAEDFIKLFEDLSSEEANKLWEATYDKVYNNLKDNQDEALKDYTIALEKSKNSFKREVAGQQQNYLEDITTNLILNKDFKEDDTALQYYKDFLANTVLSTDELERIFEENNNDHTLYGKAVDKIIYDTNAAYIDSFKNLTEEQKEQWGDFQSNLANMSWEEKTQGIIDLINELKIQDPKIVDYFNKKVTESNENLSDAATKAFKTGGGSEQNFTDVFRQEGEAAVDAYSKAVTDQFASEKTRAKMNNAMLKLWSSGLSLEQINIGLNSGEWENMSTLVFDSTREKYIQSLMELENLSQQEATAIADAFIDTLQNSGVFTTNLVDSDQVNAAADEINSFYDGLIDKGSKFSQFFEKNTKILALSGKELNDLQKAFEDISKETGFTFSMDKYLSTDSTGQSLLNVERLKNDFDNLTSRSKDIKKEIDKLKALGSNITDEDKENLKVLEETYVAVQRQEAAARNVLGVEQSINEQIDKRISKISSLISAYKSFGSQIGSQGFADASSIEGLISAIYALNPDARLQDYFSATSINKDAINNLIDKTIAEQETSGATREEIANLKLQKIYLREANEEIAKSTAEKNELQKATEETTKAYKEWQKAIEDVTEREKDLNEAIHGSDKWIREQDGAYNYTLNLERLAKAADDAKSALDDLQDNDNASELMKNYLKSVNAEAAVGAAETRIYQQALENNERVLNEELRKSIEDINKKRQAAADKYNYSYSPINSNIQASDLYSLVGDRYNVNYGKINSLQIPNDYKDEIVNLVKQRNEYLDKLEEQNERERKRRKEFYEFQKQSLTDMTDLEEKMKNTLKEKYEQEIKDIEAKYSAMEEADNEYVDALSEAIEKQRKLRDQENSWSELADKERRLSLMSRDTSSANRVETMSLQRDIEKNRQDLLDQSVDNIIDGLKELYEDQKETREIEIEYRRSLLDESALMREAVEALDQINTAEDLVTWFYENTANLSDMSERQIKLEELQWHELFDAKTVYLETSMADFNSALETTELDIQRIVDETSQTITEQAKNSLDSVNDTVNDNIKSAQDSLSSALDTLKDRHEAYNKALEVSAQLQQTYNTTIQEFSKLIKELDKETTNQNWAERRAREEQDRVYGRTKLFNQNRLDIQEPYESPVSGLTNEEYARVYHAQNSSNISTIETFKNWFYSAGVQQQLREGKTLQRNMSGVTKQDIKDIIPTTGIGAYTVVQRANGEFYISKNLPKAYASGGLVNFTGPAWVDGSPQKPEAFLSPEDTKRIGDAAKILADLPIFKNNFDQNQITNNNIGDTHIDIHINIENVASDYDVDQAVERVKQDIVNAANYKGSNVILHKK